MEMKFYRCSHCGQIIAIVKETGVPVVCCGEPMAEVIPGTTDASLEKEAMDFLLKKRVDGLINMPVDIHGKNLLEWYELSADQILESCEKELINSTPHS